METKNHIRLRNSVHVAPVEGGLYFVGWQETLMISGPPSLARLWEKLFPHLHRGVDREALMNALPPKARDTAVQLLDELQTNGFLRREAPDAPSPKDSADHPSHERTLEFLDSAAAEPQAAFRDLRESPVAIIGEGPIVEATVRCLLELGAGELYTTDAQAAAHFKHVAVDTGATLTAIGVGSTDEDTTRRLPLVRVEIDADHPALPDTTTTVGLVQLSDQVVIAPLSSGTEAPGIDVTVNRMRVRNSHLTRGPVSPALARMAGNLAALQVFYHLTGVSTEFDDQAYVIETERLQTTLHPVWTPGTPGAIPVDSDRVYECEPDRIIELTDSVTGVLPDVGPQDLSQVPMALATADERTDGSETPFGWGITGDVARYRAVLDVAHRSLAPPPDSGLWPVADSSGGPRAPRVITTCAGVDLEGMLADGAVRLIGQWLDDPSERSARFVSVDRETFATRQSSGPAWKQALVQEVGVAIDTKLTVETFRATATDEVHVVEAAVDGRRVGLWAHPDVDAAWHVAVRHATSVFQGGGQRSDIPILATPPGAPQAEEVSTWTIAEVLAPLCRPEETIVAARSTAEPALEILGTVGWLGISVKGDSE